MSNEHTSSGANQINATVATELDAELRTSTAQNEQTPVAKSTPAGSSAWTVQRLLQWMTTHFQTKGIDSPRLDAELLLAEALKCKRLDLYMRFEQPLKDTELATLRAYVERRSTREPVAYILGEKEFYGRKFRVDPSVLIPRPETEHVVDLTLAHLKTRQLDKEALQILDVGTGSGCLAITLALELEKAHVTAVDLSTQAVATARQNAANLWVEERVKLIEADFEKWKSDLVSYDVIVSNPPYVGLNTEAKLAPEVARFEPRLALFGGEAGFELIARWAAIWKALLKPNGLLVFEIGFDQGLKVREILEALGFASVNVHRDYAGLDRVIVATV